MNRQPFVVLVTSSRDWSDRDAVWTTLDAVARSAAQAGFPSVQVRHGHCRKGGDEFADEWVTDRLAKGWRVEVDRWPADWKTGKNAGFNRNSAMVGAGGDLCSAFLMPCVKPRCASKKPHYSHGATHCADRAEAAGIRTARICFDPDNTSPEGGLRA